LFDLLYSKIVYLWTRGKKWRVQEKMKGSNAKYKDPPWGKNEGVKRKI
jgi:hypothetical protein